MKIRPLTINDVVITVEAMDEEASIEDELSDCGEDYICVIKNRLYDEGNIWAWCMVKVTVSWNDLKATSYLGCCSCDDKESFIKNSGYYDNMVDEALDELNKSLQNLVDKISELEIKED